MNLNDRIELVSELGQFFKKYLDTNYDNTNDDKLIAFEKTIQQGKLNNPWFTDQNMKVNLSYWAEKLNKYDLTQWMNNYDTMNVSSKSVAIIMAGNIPLVGFHDFLSVFLCGHNSIIKLSSNDKHILPFLTNLMISINNELSKKIIYIEGKLQGYDAVIATGSNNTSRYFEYYFKNKKSIIRKNRNSIAVLDGSENEDDLSLLGDDIFTYFGLGCRSISKLYVPENYCFDLFFNSIFKWNDLINSHKYANNYDYNKAIYLMSEYKFFDNGFFMVKEGSELYSPISTINYEFYNDISTLKQKIKADDKDIQCIVSNTEIENKINFGETQKPSLSQYADNIDVVEFLLTI
jgi:hypothetical protein|tara:strand:+ start:464 stop:1507 length:1044 start_codon:yes stop_codon:yes gene_type:complete